MLDYLLFCKHKHFVKLPFKPNTDSILKHEIPCILHVLLLPFIQAGFKRLCANVQMCKVNFYHADDLFLKTKRNIQMQLFHFPISCYISLFLEYRSILFCNVQCNASFTSFFFFRRKSLYILWYENSMNGSFQQPPNIFYQKTRFSHIANLGNMERCWSLIMYKKKQTTNKT